MALELQLCAEFSNCNKLILSDITKAYNLDSNPTGWGVPNLITSNITEATIIVSLPSEESLAPIDIIDSFPATVTDKFKLTEVEEEFEDGEYIIEYIVVDNGEIEYRATIKIYNLCNSRCCIDKLWAKVGDNLAKTNSCGCNTTTYYEDALYGEALIRAIKSASGCLNTEVRESILEKLNKLCEANNCNC